METTEIEIGGVKVNVRKPTNVSESARDSFDGLKGADKMQRLPGSVGFSKTLVSVLLPVYFTAVFKQKGRDDVEYNAAVIANFDPTTKKFKNFGHVSTSRLFRTDYKYFDTTTTKLAPYEKSYCGFPVMEDLIDTPEDYLKARTEKKEFFGFKDTRDVLVPDFDEKGRPKYENDLGARLSYRNGSLYGISPELGVLDDDSYKDCVTTAMSLFTKE